MKTSRRVRAIEFIRHQINVDLSPLVRDEHSTRTYLTFDFDALGDVEQRMLKSLIATNGKEKMRLESNGGLGMALIYKGSL